MGRFPLLNQRLKVRFWAEKGRNFGFEVPQILERILEQAPMRVRSDSRIPALILTPSSA
jgi:hypothetical protein